MSKKKKSSSQISCLLGSQVVRCQRGHETRIYRALGQRQRNQCSKKDLEKENGAGLKWPDFKTSYEATVVRTRQYCEQLHARTNGTEQRAQRWTPTNMLNSFFCWIFSLFLGGVFAIINNAGMIILLIKLWSIHLIIFNRFLAKVPKHFHRESVFNKRC